MSKEKKKKISNEIQVQQQDEKEEYKNDYYEGLDEWRRLEKWRPGRRNFA